MKKIDVLLRYSINSSKSLHDSIFMFLSSFRFSKNRTVSWDFAKNHVEVLGDRALQNIMNLFWPINIPQVAHCQKGFTWQHGLVHFRRRWIGPKKIFLFVWADIYNFSVKMKCTDSTMFGDLILFRYSLRAHDGFCIWQDNQLRNLMVRMNWGFK
jgi:hypothetical protein